MYYNCVPARHFVNGIGVDRQHADDGLYERVRKNAVPTLTMRIMWASRGCTTNITFSVCVQKKINKLWEKKNVDPTVLKELIARDRWVNFRREPQVRLTFPRGYRIVYIYLRPV